MAARTLIDVQNRIVFGVGVGPLTFWEIVQQRATLGADSQFCGDFRQVLDFDDVTDLQVSATEVRLLAADDIFATTARRAFVASADAVVALAELFAAYRGRSIRVVKTLADAARWVDVDPAIVIAAINALRSTR